MESLQQDFTKLMELVSVTEKKHAEMISQLKAEALPLLDVGSFGLSMTENLINDMMDLGKLQNGVFSFDQQYFSLPEVVKNAFSIIKSTADSKGIELEANIKNKKHLVYLDNLCGDPRRYIQILLNFLSNALKFTPNNGKIIIRLEKIDFMNVH